MAGHHRMGSQWFLPSTTNWVCIRSIWLFEIVLCLQGLSLPLCSSTWESPSQLTMPSSRCWWLTWFCLNDSVISHPAGFRLAALPFIHSGRSAGEAGLPPTSHPQSCCHWLNLSPDPFPMWSYPSVLFPDQPDFTAENTKKKWPPRNT